MPEGARNPIPRRKISNGKKPTNFKTLETQNKKALPMNTNEQLLKQHLVKMLNEVEANIDNNAPLSSEHLEEYCAAAIFMSKTYGRKGDRVAYAEMMLSEIVR